MLEGEGAGGFLEPKDLRMEHGEVVDNESLRGKVKEFAMGIEHIQEVMAHMGTVKEVLLEAEIRAETMPLKNKGFAMEKAGSSEERGELSHLQRGGQILGGSGVSSLPKEKDLHR